MQKVDLGRNPEILIFSDAHFHEFKPFSVPTKSGVGSRFEWLLKAFEAIIQYALEHNIIHIFFLGDLFHQRTLLYSIVFDKVTEIIEKAVRRGIEFHFILGNHDYIYNSDTSPSIVKRIKDVDVIDEARVYFVRNFDERIACIPFRFLQEKLKEDLELVKKEIEETARPDNDKVNHILLGHFELSGAEVNDEYILKDSIDPHIFSDTLFPVIFSGHVHRAQTLTLGDKKIEFVGHTLQQTFGDEKNSYGFFIYNFSTKDYKFIPLRTLGEFPEFHTVEIHSQEDIKEFVKSQAKKLNTDYFRVRTYSEELKVDNLFKKLSFYTADSVDSVTSKKTEDGKEAVQFNLNINYYLKLFAEQEEKVNQLEWLETQKLMEYLDKLLEKGNICLS